MVSPFFVTCLSFPALHLDLVNIVEEFMAKQHTQTLLDATKTGEHENVLTIRMLWDKSYSIHSGDALFDSSVKFFVLKVMVHWIGEKRHRSDSVYWLRSLWSALHLNESEETLDDGGNLHKLGETIVTITV